MTALENLKLTYLLPEIVHSLIEKLKIDNRRDLLKQVEDLSIVCLCECGDQNCGSFYTIDPSETKNDQIKHEGISTNLGLIEVYDGKIGFIEIMPSEIGKQIRNKIVMTMKDDDEDKD